MRLARPSYVRSLITAGITATLSLTTLPAFAAANHSHTSGEAAVIAPIATAAEARQKAYTHTQALMALQKQWANAKGTEKSHALEKMLAKAEERRAYLLELMESNPAEVLHAAIPAGKQLEMPAEVLEYLEQSVELEGKLEVAYEDYPDGTHKLRHILNTPFGERFDLHFADKHSGLKSSPRVQASGLVFSGSTNEVDTLTGAMVLESADSSLEFMDCCESSTSTTSIAPELTRSYGEKRALVILVNFQDKAEQPWTQEEVRHVFFDQTNAYFLENSSGQTSLSGNVTGWYTLPISSTVCDEGAIMTHAHEAAQNAGVDLSGYDRFVYAFPKNACSWAGRAQIGGSTTPAWLNGYVNLQVVSHELGHNFGLGHSKSLECGTGTIEGSCYTIGYGDTLDTMGYYNPGHYNAFHKERLGWLGYDNMPGIQTVEASGTYTLSAYQASDSAPSALKVLKSVDPSTGRKTWYYIEYRQAQGFDSFISDPENPHVDEQNILNGVVIHLATEGNYDSSQLLDMTPGSNPAADFSDPALTVSKSFSDSDAGIMITTNWVNGTQASIEISLGAQPCTATAPLLSVAPSDSSWAAAGTAVHYDVTLTNQDSASCPSAAFDLSAAAPSDWASTFDSNELSLAPGETASTTLTVTSPNTAPDGYYDIGVTGANGGYSTNATVTYVVDTPTEPNSAPVANDDSATTNANTSVTINVLENDSDQDGDALSVTSVSGVQGTATINSDGSITYTPNSGFTGSATFTYTISDGQGNSASASVSVLVTEVVTPNQAPIAVNDSAAVPSKSPVTIMVLANDYDPDGDKLEITEVTQGSKGQVTINTDGTLTYIPAKNFKGSDTFSYVISDGLKSGSAVVSISAQDDSGSTSGGKGNGKGNNKP